MWLLGAMFVGQAVKFLDPTTCMQRNNQDAPIGEKTPVPWTNGAFITTATLAAALNFGRFRRLNSKALDIDIFQAKELSKPLPTRIIYSTQDSDEQASFISFSCLEGV